MGTTYISVLTRTINIGRCERREKWGITVSRLERFKRYLVNNRWRKANSNRAGLVIYVEPCESSKGHDPMEIILPTSDKVPGSDVYIGRGIEILSHMGVDMFEVPV